MIHRFALLLLGLCTFTASADPPKLDYLYPAGGQVGSTVTVTAGGTLKPWPADVWSSTDKLTFEPQKKAGQFEVKIAEDASPGLHLIRMTNAEGVSDIKPFIVSTSTEVVRRNQTTRPKTR